MMKYFLLLLFFLFSVEGFSCDCKSVSVTKAAVESYDVILTGTTVAVSGCDKNAKVKFLASKLFKGKCYESLEIKFDCSSDCQMSFEPGQEWIIYGKYTSYGEITVEFCSLSRMKMDAAQDYNTATHGISYTDELVFLEKELGVQPFNVIKIEDTQHHELLHPSYMQQFWLLLASIGGVVTLYFLIKKFLR